MSLLKILSKKMSLLKIYLLNKRGGFLSLDFNQL